MCVRSNETVLLSNLCETTNLKVLTNHSDLSSKLFVYCLGCICFPCLSKECIDISSGCIHSLVSNQAGSGSRIDLARLGRFCRERGIVLAVDAIQGLGRLKMDVEECCVDFLTCGGFKGLAAGFGIGFLYCADWLLPRVEPLLAGDFCTVAELNAPEVYREDFPMDYLDSALRFEGGSSNTPGIWQLHHALSLIQELGGEQIEDHILSLERRLRAAIAHCGLDVLPAGEKPSGMVIAWYPRERCSQAEEILKKYKIHMTHHEGYLRLSIALHNTPEQMDAVAAAFREIGKLKG